MRKLFALLALALLVSCSEIVQIIPAPAYNVRVYDSAWDILVAERLEDSRSITSTAALEAELAAYNASHLDDLRRLILGEEEIPASAAPAAIGYIVAPVDFARLAVYSVPRAELAEAREEWRAQALTLGGVLYVDREPPAYIPPRVITDYERYALYLVDSLGKIQIENHCEAWLPNGWPSIDEYFRIKREVYADDARTGTWGENRPWRLIAGELYEEP